MRHHTAAQLALGGGWHYVSMGKTGGHALGYCAEHKPHATEAEARACYGQWRRDHIVLDGQLSSWTDCMAGRTTDPSSSVRCPNPTKQYARIDGDGYSLAPLCPEHLTLEHAIPALHADGPAGDSWQS